MVDYRKLAADLQMFLQSLDSVRGITSSERTEITDAVTQLIEWLLTRSPVR